MAARKKTQNKAPSKAYFTFERTIERSLNLIVLQKPTERIIIAHKTTSQVDSSDLLRAALVLGVAAMDSYFTDIFAERFVPYLKKKGPNKEMVILLEEAGLGVEMALEIITMRRPYRRIRTLVEDYLEKKVTQKLFVIDDLFLVFSLKDFTQNIARLKGRKTLLRSVTNAVKRRHKIAHEGDINSRGKLNRITVKDVKHKLTDIVLFVAGADEILQSQLQ